MHEMLTRDASPSNRPAPSRICEQGHILSVSASVADLCAPMVIEARKDVELGRCCCSEEASCSFLAIVDEGSASWTPQIFTVEEV